MAGECGCGQVDQRSAKPTAVNLKVNYMQLKTLYCGTWRVVAPLSEDGTCELEASLMALADNRKLRASVVGLAALWDRIPRTGPKALGTSLYHCIDDKASIYEFIKGDLRLLCFEVDGATVVCSHVFVKKSQKTPARVAKRAVELKKQYLQALQKGDVHIANDDE